MPFRPDERIASGVIQPQGQIAREVPIALVPWLPYFVKHWLASVRPVVNRGSEVRNSEWCKSHLEYYVGLFVDWRIGL